MDPPSTDTYLAAGLKRKRSADRLPHGARERSEASAPLQHYARPSGLLTASHHGLASSSRRTFHPSPSSSQHPHGKHIPSVAPLVPSAGPFHDPSFTQGLENCQQTGGTCHTASDPFACSWEEFSKQCGITSVPCNNPACEDVSPCPATTDECSDPLKCLGNICYDQECVPSGLEGSLWCNADCDEATRCVSPCFSDECGVPACNAPCLESKPASEGSHAAPQLPPGHQLRPNDVLCQTQDCAIPAFQCVDPRCLVNGDGPSTHFHHDLRNFYDDFAQENFGIHAQTSQQTQDPFSLALGSHTDQSEAPELQMLRGRSKNAADPMEFIVDFNKQPYPPMSVNDASWSTSSMAVPELSHSLTATPKSTDTSDLRTTVSSSPAQSLQYTCMWAANTDGMSCLPCGQVFRDASDLHSHVERAHIDSLQREVSGAVIHGYWCRWEGCARNRHGNPSTSFAARPKLKRHIQTHTLYKPFICDTCGVSMKTKDAMEKHLRTHTGERPYRCPLPQCAKIFATSTELKTHMVVHSGKKPHECPICGESFADSSNLSKHKKTHFLGMYRCPEAGCGARMKRWDQMRRHIVSQGHSKYLLDDMDAQREYKVRMEKEWKELPDEQKMLTDSSHTYTSGA